MPNEIAPAPAPAPDDDHAPGDGAGQNSEHVPRAGRRRADDNDTPSREGALRRAWNIPKLIALQIVTPAQANAMSRATAIYLDYSGTSQPATSVRPADANILSQLRANPDLLEWFESYLTDEDIARVMRGVQDDAQPET